jgi:hypothetical protein
MKKAYDRSGAKRLVPLLEAITREIADRGAEIQRLQERAEALARSRSPERLHVQAELAVQRRELRACRRELDSLGCVVDDTDPTEVLIPGRDGEIEHGFRWHFGEEGIRAVASDSTRA